MSLFRIVFVSDAVGAAGEGLLPLIDIIGVSDRNNRRDHVSSLILRHDSRFLQIMEGARVDLDRALSRIRADRRHCGIRILSDRPVTQGALSAHGMTRIDATPELDALIRSDLSSEDAGVQAEQLLMQAHRATVNA